MADGIQVRVTGIPDLTEALRGIVPKLRVRALRNSLAAGARLVQRAAVAAAPALSPASLPVRKGYRTAGLLRKSIQVRTSKVARRKGDVGVFVNVRPAKGAQYRSTSYRIGGIRTRVRSLKAASQRGAKSKLDPYYWRWVEFGSRGKPGRGFLQAGARQLDEALRVFLARIGPAIQKLNRPKAPAP